MFIIGIIIVITLFVVYGCILIALIYTNDELKETIHTNNEMIKQLQEKFHQFESCMLDDGK
jgi:uncharacterized protein YneF (UPF0154 family)